MNLKARIAKLEVAGPSGLPPSVRRWLGISLSDAETVQANKEDAERLPFDPVAVAEDATLSREVKQWLLQV